MLYKEFLKKKRACPFCRLSNQVIVTSKLSFLTYAVAPYTDGHLLVIPKRHVDSFLALTQSEHLDIEQLLEKGVAIVKHLGYSNYSILVRNGDNHQKSVKHLHYHIIPNHRIGDLDATGQPRAVLTKIAELALIKTLKVVVKKCGFISDDSWLKK